ncbi:hypothetical protein E5163_02875 [Marinicauda algicola]|uniref:Uncharacterized protein n=1 Tax=Marinicauda algicola TaxID=2029849 RepID=A0A4S2H3X6_9PROT|nr:hypothetical protein [Marinicauda algicola]TGY90088.1 hypothetical protein E5163_02875 [Marinicauda algicola]
MILRRITEHVRAQNWTAVGLDFVIVVLGVFIGIQVANWNEARALQREERSIVLRLLTEADRSAVEIEEAVALTERFRATAVRGYETLQLEAIDQAAADQLRTDLSEMGSWKDEEFVRATLDQIVSSGDLSLIRSQSLQDTIAGHREVIASATKAFANIGGVSLSQRVEMNDRLQFRFTESGREITTPASDLLADEALERHLAQFGLIYHQFLQLHRQSLELNAQYRAALATYAQEKGWLE